MDFNFKGFFRFMHLWLSNGRWTARRVAIFIAFCLGFPLLELTIWLGFLFDNIFFRGYRREGVHSPVFIIGNPRSGTTFLHRLMARDVERFTTMGMWEILFAPSITLRKVVHGFSTLLVRLGISPHKQLNRIEGNWHEQAHAMHNISFSEPEEDDYLLLHIWSALTTGLSSGLLKEAIPYVYFDTAIPRKERNRIMAFYKRCVQRHLYAQRRFKGTEPRGYLAKNPALCPKVDTLLEVFPGAKIIYLVRNPLEMIPSYVSMMDFSWRAVGVLNRDQMLKDFIFEMAQHWYRYPIKRLEKWPEDNYIIIKYDDLVKDPEHTVKKIYSRLGFEVSPSFGRVLRESAMNASHYKSRHKYLLEDMGLDRRRIFAEFRDIFERFQFDRPLESNPRIVMAKSCAPKRLSVTKKSSEGSDPDRIKECLVS